MHTLTDLVVVGTVSGVIPIEEQTCEECTTFPPLARESTGNLTGFVSMVPGHGPVSGLTGGILDGTYTDDDGGGQLSIHNIGVSCWNGRHGGLNSVTQLLPIM